MQLTLQIYHQARWQDAALVELPSPELGTRGPARLGYLQEYALAWMFHDDEHACSLTLPVELMMTHRCGRWFGFLEDIMPTGASRRYWVDHLDLQDLSAGEQDSDLLNMAFGNSDNHGRNAALLKRPEGIWHAPVYDFAPMKADPEGITRTTQWGPELERGGDIDWPAVADSLGDLVAPERLMAELQAQGERLRGLRDRLADRGVPARILDMPAVGLNHLDARLARWGLA